MLLSDDQGKTWRLSRSFFPGSGEGSVAETQHGLLFVARRTAVTHCTNPAAAHCVGVCPLWDAALVILLRAFLVLLSRAL